MTFKPVNQRQSFPELEKEIIADWKANDTFKKSIETRESAEEFNFYDGPPFATGTPHYGHILAGTIKDVIPRYQTMLGKKVERRFGWDCHGLPIENIVEKKLQISGRDDIENKIGVHDFNEACRENVFGYVDEWKKSVERMGRWVDMENDYKTMDAKFMESVWWVFKTIYDKGLIYEGNRIVPYCPRCTTPLSNFEVNQGYKDKQSKTVTIKFKVLGTENKYILAWTTTPWTLYANLGLAVGSDIDYVELLDKSNGDTYVLAQDKVKDYYKKEEDYQIVRSYKGACLVGIKYEPLFVDFSVQLNDMGKDLGTGIKLGKNAFSVVAGHHVTTETGTGVVHIAPAYGEDDFIIGEKENLGFVAHIDNSGKTYNLLDQNGINVFEFNEMVVAELKEKKLSVNIGTIVHSYPHCWRCDTPLIYRGISAWYVAVEKIRDRMVANNEKINWVPDVIKHGRFGKWLEGAKDWNISRNRYWGSAIPVWQSEDKKQEWCVGSVQELFELNKDFGQIERRPLSQPFPSEEKGDIKYQYFYTSTGKEVDLHKHFVDEIFVKNENNFVGKNILLVHGRGTDINSEKWIERKKIFEDNGMNLDLFQFDKSDDPTYESWKETFDKINFEKYDVVYTSSLGGLMTTKYFIENKIKVKRLVMAVPGISFSTIKGEKPNISKIWESIENNLTNKIADEIIVLHAKDDEVVPFEAGKNFSNILKANFIEFEKGGHSLEGHLKILMGAIKYGTPLKRIPEVLDCWFESGAMPYASKHYPFENKENFKFPADFIAEGLDQTRGWFYTLIILSTALFDNTAFLNCIVNGIILAEDGKKMSKSLKNYTDPNILMDKHGADAMRFYLMNSPVVEAQDLRFSDAGVEEVVKKVILPLWNTYSFFTTYANIDNFEPKAGNVYYVRHGQTQNNAEGRMNAGESNDPLNETGKSQATKAGQNFKITGVKLEKMYISPRARTRETAELIAKELGYAVEIIEDERLVEQYAGKFDRMTHDEIKKMYNVATTSEMRRLYKEENGVENIEKFEQRVLEAYQEIAKGNEGKNVLIVAHAGTFRPINRYLNNLSKYEAHFAGDSCDNGVIYKLPNYVKNNPLDRWIVSELHTLTGDITASLDTYKLNDAAKPIVKFMDNLTNWYIRRSRKRFWKNETDSDKLEAYNTLYDVLTETSKVIAPYMPFVSDYIFKNLTGKTSVHLELYPAKNRAFIFEELNKNTAEAQDIITLGLAARANGKIRVRQPLNYVKVSHPLTPYFEEIIKEELNVKEVKVFADNEIPSQICKPNARLIGPKFGQNVKFIISEAKLGNFELLPNGGVKVGEFELQSGEFELEFVSSETTQNENEILESGNGLVVSLDKTITQDLRLEGYTRDIVRHVQESRKESNFNVDDRITLSLSGELVSEILSKFQSYIEAETLSTIVGELSNADFEKEVEAEDLKVTLKLKK